MAEPKMLRQIISTAELYANGEAIAELLRDHLGGYDADSLEEVLVDEAFVQRLKSKGYELLAEGDPRAERGAQRRPMPRAGAPMGGRPAPDSGPRVPVRNGSGTPMMPNRPGGERNVPVNRPPSAGATPFRPASSGGSDGGSQRRPDTNGTNRQLRPGGVPMRPASSSNDGERGSQQRPTVGRATPVPEIPAAEVPELPVAVAPTPVVTPPSVMTAAPPSETPLVAVANTLEGTDVVTPVREPVTERPAAVEAQPVPAPSVAAESQPADVPPVAATSAEAPKPAARGRSRTTKAATTSTAASPAEGGDAPAPKPRRTTRKAAPPVAPEGAPDTTSPATE